MVLNRWVDDRRSSIYVEGVGARAGGQEHAPAKIRTGKVSNGPLQQHHQHGYVLWLMIDPLNDPRFMDSVVRFDHFPPITFE